MRSLPWNWNDKTKVLSSKHFAFEVAAYFLVTAMTLLGANTLAVADDTVTTLLIESAPPEFRRLIDNGNVRFQIDDDKLNTMKKSGLTEFHFSVDQKFRYRIQPVSASAGNSNTFRITVGISSFKYEINHTIYLKSTMDMDRAWQQSILKHEFDHVAISTDPRIERLARFQLGSTFSFLHQTDGPQPADDALTRLVDEEMKQRREKVQQCIQSNYDLLDQISKQGRSNIDDRSTFFEQLFMQENLEKSGFILPADLKRTVNSPKYKNIGKHYDLLTGP